MRLTEEEKAEATALIRDAVSNRRIVYQCCFCKQGTEGDVAAVVIIAKWNLPEEEQSSQQWFCHLECFEKTTGERFDAARETRDAIATADRMREAKWSVGGIEVTPERGIAAFRAALGPHKGE